MRNKCETSNGDTTMIYDDHLIPKCSWNAFWDIHRFQQRKRVQFLWVPTASAEMLGRTSHLALGCSLHPLETNCCRKLARTICWQSQNTFHLAMGHGPIIKCLRLRVARARASKGPATNLGVQLKSDSNGCSG